MIFLPKATRNQEPEVTIECLDTCIREYLVNPPFIHWVMLANKIKTPVVEKFINYCNRIVDELKSLSNSWGGYVEKYTYVERVSDNSFILESTKALADA